jgi:hypothetical protein
VIRTNTIKYAGIRDQQVNRLSLIDRGVPKFDGLGVAHISDLAMDIGATVAHGFGDFFEPVFPACEQRERASCACILKGQSGAYARASARERNMCCDAATLYGQYTPPACS